MSSSILAIVGAGGHARVVADTALEAGWKDVAFFDDRYPDIGSTGPWRVSGTVSDLYSRTQEYGGVIVAIGDNDVRLSHHLAFTERDAVMASIVHPRAWVSSRSRVGPGVMLSASSVVNIGAVVGAACIVNTGATVDHDCELGEAVHIAPGAHLSGNVRVGPRSWIGVGATVRQGIRIGTGVMVGAGAVVVSDLADGVVAVGCPARPRN